MTCRPAPVAIPLHCGSSMVSRRVVLQQVAVSAAARVLVAMGEGKQQQRSDQQAQSHPQACGSAGRLIRAEEHYVAN
jgi:hypothetical protein